MAELFDPKFNIDKTYTCKDFIFRMEELLANCGPNDDSFRAILQKNITWAKSCSDDDIIAWEIRENGWVYPYIITD